MGWKEAVGYLLLGVVFFMLIRQIARVTKIKIPSGTIQSVWQIGSLLFIAANISITSCFFLLTKGGNAMTPYDLHTIAIWAYAFWALAFVLGGGIIAAILSAFLSAFRNRVKSQSSSPDAIDKTGEQIGNKPKSEFTPCANIGFAILEVIFLAAALSFLFFRFEVVYSNTPAPIEDNFLLYWCMDMRVNWYIYAIVAGLLLLWAVAKGWRIIDSDKKEKWQAMTLFLIAKELGISESDIDAELQKRKIVAKRGKRKQKRGRVDK